NDYTCDQSAALVRGIYYYHSVTNGWGDIGYNALVDKCGTIFEGRTGGLHLPTIDGVPSPRRGNGAAASRQPRGRQRDRRMRVPPVGARRRPAAR
ncbi:hypothetical protein AB0H93_42265, partial [Saccharopolyspora sp. NPDC050642]